LGPCFRESCSLTLMERDMSDTGFDIRRRLIALPESSEQDLEGASEEEIRELEKYAGGPLPAVYKQFLKQLGRSAGELFRGSDYSVSQRFRLHLREHAEALLLRSNAPFVLPKTAFVFLMSQGYQFSFFYIGQGDDPGVYHYLEGDPLPRQLDATLSGYLLRCIEECERRTPHLSPK
jgi:SMI1/KNR4 family protein SUKH-1